MSGQFCNKAKIMVGDEALERISFEIYNCNCTRIFIIVDTQSVSTGASKMLERIINYTDVTVTYVKLRVKKYATIDDAVLAHKIFRDSKCEFIICLGGDVVTNIAMAVKLMANLGSTNIFGSSNYVAEDKIPLMLVPTNVNNFNNVNFGVGRAVIFDENNVSRTLTGRTLAPNHIVIDKRMIIKVKNYVQDIRVVMAVGMSLIALMEEETPLSAKVFSFAALDIARDQLFDEKVNLKKYPDKIINAIVNANIAYSGSYLNVFAEVVANIAERKNLQYYHVFACMIDRQLAIAANRLDDVDVSTLGIYIGDEGFFCLPNNERRIYVIGVFRCILSKINQNLGLTKTLTELGVTPDDAESIINEVVAQISPRASETQIANVKELINYTL